MHSTSQPHNGETVKIPIKEKITPDKWHQLTKHMTLHAIGLMMDVGRDN